MNSPLTSSVQKIALIGTSGTGKTKCLENLNLREGNMDEGLDTGTRQSMDTMLDWILDNSSPIIAVSVHIEALKEMAKKKQENGDSRFSSILFIYLYVSKDILRQRLQSRDDKDNVDGSLNTYESTDPVFQSLADCCIVTTQTSELDVAQKVKQMASRFNLL